MSVIIMCDLWVSRWSSTRTLGSAQETSVTTSVEPHISRWRTLLCRVEDVVVALRGRMSWGAWMVSVLGIVTIVSRSPGLLYNGMFDRDESYLAVTGD